MGKRSLTTTKNGKYMNPTDQARKEQRRRELKKNKKQREVVRAAIIKSKEPKRIIEEMEMLDEMEYNPVQSASLTTRVLQEKRRKLKETLDKIREMMEKDSPESVGEFRQMMANYEKRRAQRQVYYEQVKNAERVRPDQIPLPNEVPPSTLPGDIPLPGRSTIGQPAHGILKKTPTIITESSTSKVVFRSLKNIPPPPPCQPPDLSDSDDEQSASESSSLSSDESVSSESPSESSSQSESEKDEEANEAETLKPPRKSLRFADDVSFDSTKDTRLTVGKERQQKRAEEDETPYDPEQPVESEQPARFFNQPPPPALPSYVPPGYPPHLPPMMASRMPPMPPAFGTGAPGFADIPSQRQVRRLPGGKLVLAGGPTVLQAGPTTSAQRTDAAQQQQQQMSQQQSHQMAPPPADPKVTTIERKAQLKNLLHESTKFVPPQLKVRREYKDAHGRLIKPSAQPARPSTTSSTQRPAFASNVGASSSAAVSAARAADKDDSYAQFMKSLDGLL